MARPRDHLPRPNVPQLNMPQPGLNFQGQPIFSPVVQNYRPTFPVPNPMQTPMQSFFSPAPGRLTHHQSRASIAHLASVGIHPPAGFTPMTPIGGGHFPRASMSIPSSSSSHPFSNRNRRQLSIGGPPKAVLGGPTRKLSPLPAVAAASMVTSQKVKKVNVKLPKETISGEEEAELSTREPWARHMLDGFEFKESEVVSVELTTAEAYPPDEWRHHMPDTLDVFLPGELAWEEMKQKEIEEKLEKLGVERGFGSNVPHIHAPHARAASISSPADPQILLYKLNKLQQSQEDAGSGKNSLTTSPHLLFGGLSSSPLSSSPHMSSANRHGHAMSLAHPSSQSFLDSNGSTYNPFGPSIGLEVDPIPYSGPSALQGGIHSSHGHVPLTLNSLPPNATSRPTSRPDFIRGFGLDIPEEEEEEEGAKNAAEETHEEELDGDGEQVIKYSPVQLASHSPKTERNVDGAATVSQSRYHSRHASKLSAALSTQSANVLDTDHFIEEENLAIKNEVEAGDQENNLEDLVGEWTGSEDVYTGETTDDEESIGEWSNPSDEEKARIERHERRNSRRASAQIDVPRRIPNFPRPPDNTVVMSMPARDEDIISNPSEEGASHDMARGEYLRRIDYYPRPPSNHSSVAQPHHHSRGPSAQHTAYDPAHAHSRSSSNQNAAPSAQAQAQSTQPTYAPPPRHDSLNPFAKPFVFGARGNSGSWGQISDTDVAPPDAPLLTHVRLPSLGKPLNVAAPEFKPGQFTFRPPAGVPMMPPPLPEISQPEALPEESPFKVQGREKRQRRGSSSSMEGDSMVSFRFPVNSESPSNIRYSPAVLTHKLDPSAEPFTLAGFSAAMAALPRVLREDDAASETESKVKVAPETPEVLAANPEETYNEESTAKEEVGDDSTRNDELKLPPTTNKPKRAPIPLDFKHPVSSNTVPAGLFKALNSSSGDERRRNTVRSRLSSHEIFEHSRRPSMDDSNVVQIANKGGRPRYVTDPGLRESSPMDDFFGTSHSRRRSSFTDTIRPLGRRLGADSEGDAAEDANSEMSLTGQLDTQSIHPTETIIQDGFTSLRNDIKQYGKTQRKILSDMQALKAQYAEAAAHNLKAELDLQVMTDVVERSNNQLAQVLREDLHGIRQQVWQARAGEGFNEFGPVMEQLGNRTINAVIEAISEASTRQEAIIRSAPAQERDLIVDSLVTVLTPLMSSLRAEPVDYEFLTSELTQAVKPHISQLIDLASDKQETAGLIMDRLIPMLPTSDIDVDAITQKLTAEVRRAIAPIDAFEIKEQVADLVVERLDSRLAVRDKTFNIDGLSSKVADGILKSLKPLQSVSASLEQILASQTFESRQRQVSSDQERMVNLHSELPTKLSDELQSLKTSQMEILSRLELSQTSSESDQNTLVVKAAVEEILTGQQIIASQAKDLHSFHQLIIDKLDVLPESIHTATDALQNNHIDFLKSHEATKREFDELRKVNTDYQIQVSKARGAHGQIRVERDVLSEKLASVENERDRVRSQIQDLQASSLEKTAQTDALMAKNRELEEALAIALTRLQASDVAMQANQKRLGEMEDASRELVAEKQSLQTKVNSLELQVAIANRDKESAVQTTEALQQQHDVFLAQQSNWDELRRASEKIDILASLIGKEDNEEIKELKRYCDRTKTLEHDHAALQTRFKELETKVGNGERAVTTVKQSLAQAQQRSSEWERRAKESEAQLELNRTKLEQMEQTHTQLDADYSLVKLQLEEQEANDRLTQDQLNKLREQISLLENKSNRLQSELDHAKMIKVPVPQSYRNSTNGNTHPPPRPDSRASTIYVDRSATPQKSSASTVRSSTPTGSGTVWDSMHAPKTDAHKYATPTQAPSPVASRNRYPQFGHKFRPQAPLYRPIAPPSPTPSVASLAPTQDEDGWWS
ncbi:hypothetical protein E4T56_gene20184 [Termitomyces sp. T112]|nr:hypothetical protein E4T56_gene20184 [Termitomyces sp. T112]